MFLIVTKMTSKCIKMTQMITPQDKNKQISSNKNRIV